MGLIVNGNKVTSTDFKEMLSAVDKVYELGLNVKDSYFSATRIIIKGEGYVHSINNPVALFNKLNSLGAKINTTKSRLNGSTWQLELRDDVSEVLKDLESKTSVPTPATGTVEVTADDEYVEVVEEVANEDIQEDKEEDLQESTETGITEVETEESEVESTETPDFEYASSLNTSDKKQSKIDLEEYARKFDIELARNKKFESMLEDFAEAWDNK